LIPKEKAFSIELKTFFFRVEKTLLFAIKTEESAIFIPKEKRFHNL